MPDIAHLKVYSGGVTYDAQVARDKSWWKHHAGLIGVQEAAGVGYAAYGYTDDVRALAGGPKVTVNGVDYPLLAEVFHTPEHAWITPVHLIADNIYGIFRFTVYVPRGAWNSIWCGDCNLYITAKAPYTLTSYRGYYAGLLCDNHEIAPSDSTVSYFTYEAGYMLPPGKHSISFALRSNGKTGPSALDFKTTAF